MKCACATETQKPSARMVPGSLTLSLTAFTTSRARATFPVSTLLKAPASYAPRFHSTVLKSVVSVIPK